MIRWTLPFAVPRPNARVPRRRLTLAFVLALVSGSLVTACDDESSEVEETAEPEVEVEEEAPPPTAEELAEAPEAFEGNFYVLRPGETVEELAERHGVTVEAVRRQHELDSDWYEAMNERLRHFVPDFDQAAGADFQLPTVGVSHIVAEGEDIVQISDNYKTSVMEILVVNAIPQEEATEIEVGRRLFIPGVVQTAAGEVVHIPHARQEEFDARASELDLGTRAVAARLLRGGMDERWTAAAEVEDEAWDGTFGWPVAGGWFVRGFGAGEEGYHKAVDVGGHLGWPARAIERGIVAYVGDEIVGYGNIVMIVHRQGFVSFYAHNSATFVHAGQRVTRGQIISEVGSTGISRGPHVHFELIHELLNCDPAPLFRPGVRRHDETMMDIPQLTWTDDGPPEGLRCERRPTHHPNSRWVVHEHPARDASEASGLPRQGG